MSLEEISGAFPALIPGLLKYPAIGFIMVRSEKQGTLAIGAKGTYYLLDDHFDGENPLAAFGPLAAQHLRREDEFYNTPDILVNSFYDPKSREVAAFEELVGSHGGLGGDQSRGILIYPSEFNAGSEPIVGAARLHHIIKRWLPAK
jgi:putative membrane protein